MRLVIDTLRRPFNLKLNGISRNTATSERTCPFPIYARENDVDQNEEIEKYHAANLEYSPVFREESLDRLRFGRPKVARIVMRSNILRKRY